MTQIKKAKKIIGRVEKVNFPDLHMLEVDAKIDTGAYSSALHCHDIKEYKRGKQKILSFKLLDPSHPSYNKKVLEFDNFSESRVRNSFGQVEKRYKIKTRIMLGKKVYISGFTLTNRKDMRYPVLLGRKILNKRFLVDVSRKNLLNQKQ